MRSEASRDHNAGAAAPPKVSVGVVGWLRHNLFNTWFNSVLTLACLWLIYKVASALIRWGIVNAAFGTTPDTCERITGACWSFIGAMWPLFMVGTYPFEQRWRPYTVFIIIAVLGILALFRRMRASRWFWAAWVVAALGGMLLIHGFDGLESVDTSQWGGLMLTLMLSVAGIGVSFPIGVVLALGRRSRSMPVIRAMCVGYIELIRGVPLITVLFMSSIMLPLFFPSDFEMDKLLRAQIGIILFSAAYVAEVVRGGLQAVDKGQEEAASALGLNYWMTTGFIVLPQALRIVIPPLVSTFISLLKDTSLVAIIGLFDLLGISSFATANPQWLGKILEAYVFVGAIYWAICFSMSRYSRRLEIRFRTGEY